MRSFLNQTEHWKSHDPFVVQKVQTFRQSGASILREWYCFFGININKSDVYLEIANTIHELEVDKDLLRSDPEKLRVLFTEMIQMCLWCVRFSCFLTAQILIHSTGETQLSVKKIYSREKSNSLITRTYPFSHT